MSVYVMHYIFTYENIEEVGYVSVTDCARSCSCLHCKVCVLMMFRYSIKGIKSAQPSSYINLLDPSPLSLFPSLVNTFHLPHEHTQTTHRQTKPAFHQARYRPSRDQKSTKVNRRDSLRGHGPLLYR